MLRPATIVGVTAMHVAGGMMSFGPTMGADNWERIYTVTPPTELSWHEREPATSVQLIESAASGPSSSVIDVGAGTSSLVDRLLARGYTDLTVLDISDHALVRARHRLGARE